MTSTSKPNKELQPLIDSLIRKLPETSRFSVPARRQSTKLSSDNGTQDEEGSSPQITTPTPELNVVPLKEVKHPPIRMGQVPVSDVQADTPDISVARRGTSVASDATIGTTVGAALESRMTPAGPRILLQRPVAARGQAKPQQEQKLYSQRPPSPTTRRPIIRPPEIQVYDSDDSLGRARRISSPGEEAWSPKSVTSTRPGGISNPGTHFYAVTQRLNSEILASRGAEYVPRYHSSTTFTYNGKAPRSYAAQRRSQSAPREGWVQEPRSRAAQRHADATSKAHVSQSWAARRHSEQQRSTSAPPRHSFAAGAHAVMAANQMANAGLPPAAKSMAARRRQERPTSPSAASVRHSFAARRHAEVGASESSVNQNSKSWAARRRATESQMGSPRTRSPAAERHRSAPPMRASASWAAKKHAESAREPQSPHSMAARRRLQHGSQGSKTWAAERHTNSARAANQPPSRAAAMRQSRQMAAHDRASPAGRTWAARSRDERQRAPASNLGWSRALGVYLSTIKSEGHASSSSSPTRVNQRGPSPFMNELSDHDEEPPQRSPRDSLRRAGAADKPGSTQDNSVALPLPTPLPLPPKSNSGPGVGAAPAAAGAASRVDSRAPLLQKLSSTDVSASPSRPSSQPPTDIDSEPLPAAKALINLRKLLSPRPGSVSGIEGGGPRPAAASGSGLPPNAKRKVPGHKRSKTMSAVGGATASAAAIGAAPKSKSPLSSRPLEVPPLPLDRLLPPRNVAPQVAASNSMPPAPTTINPPIVDHFGVRPTRTFSPLRGNPALPVGLRPTSASPPRPYTSVNGKKLVPDPDPQAYFIPTSRLPRPLSGVISSTRQRKPLFAMPTNTITQPGDLLPWGDGFSPRGFPRPTRVQGDSEVLVVHGSTPLPHPSTGMYMGSPTRETYWQAPPPQPPAHAGETYIQVLRDMVHLTRQARDDDVASSVPSEDTIDAMLIRDANPLLAMDLNRLATAQDAHAKPPVRTLKDPAAVGSGIRLLRPHHLGSQGLPEHSAGGHTLHPTNRLDPTLTGSTMEPASVPELTGGSFLTSGYTQKQTQAATQTLSRVNDHPTVSTVRTLSPPRLPAEDRGLSLLRMHQHQQPPPAPREGTRLLRVDRGRVVARQPASNQPGGDRVPVRIGAAAAAADIAGLYPMAGEGPVLSAHTVHPPLFPHPGEHMLGPGGLINTGGQPTHNRTAQLLGALDARDPGPMSGAMAMGFSSEPGAPAPSGYYWGHPAQQPQWGPIPGQQGAQVPTQAPGHVRIPITIPGLAGLTSAAQGPVHSGPAQLAALAKLSGLTALNQLNSLAGGMHPLGPDDPSSWDNLAETTPPTLRQISSAARPSRQFREAGAAEFSQVAGMVPRVVLDYTRDTLVDRIPAAQGVEGMGLGSGAGDGAARFAGAAGVAAADAYHPSSSALDPSLPHPITVAMDPDPRPPLVISARALPTSGLRSPLLGHLTTAPVAPSAPAHNLPLAISQDSLESSLDKPLNLTFANNLRRTNPDSPKPLTSAILGLQLPEPGFGSKGSAPLHAGTPTFSRLSSTPEEGEQESEEGEVQGNAKGQDQSGAQDEKRGEAGRKVDAPKTSLEKDGGGHNDSENGSGRDKEGRLQPAGKSQEASAVEAGGDRKHSKKSKKNKKGKKDKKKNKSKKRSHSSSSSSSDTSSSSSSSGSSNGSSSDTDTSTSSSEAEVEVAHKRHRRSKKDKDKKKKKSKRDKQASRADVKDPASPVAEGEFGRAAAERLLNLMTPRGPPSKTQGAERAAEAPEGIPGAAGTAPTQPNGSPPAPPAPPHPYLAMDDILHSGVIEERARRTVESWKAARASQLVQQRQMQQAEAAAEAVKAAAAAAVQAAKAVRMSAASSVSAPLQLAPSPAPAGTAAATSVFSAETGDQTRAAAGGGVLPLGSDLPLPPGMDADQVQAQLSKAFANALKGPQDGAAAAHGSTQSGVGAPIQIFCTNLTLPQHPPTPSLPAALAPAPPAPTAPANAAETVPAGAGAASVQQPPAPPPPSPPPPTSHATMATAVQTVGTWTTESAAQTVELSIPPAEVARGKGDGQPTVPTRPSATTVHYQGVIPLDSGVPDLSFRGSSHFGDGSALTLAPVSNPARAASAPTPGMEPEEASKHPDTTTIKPSVLDFGAGEASAAAATTERQQQQEQTEADDKDAMALELTQLILKVFKDGSLTDDLQGQESSTALNSGSAQGPASRPFFLTDMFSVSDGSGSTQARAMATAREPTLASLGPQAQPPPPSTQLLPLPPMQQPQRPPQGFVAVADVAPSHPLPSMIPNPSVPRGAEAPGFLQVFDVLPVLAPGNSLAAPVVANLGAGGPGSAAQLRLQQVKQRMQAQMETMVQGPVATFLEQGAHTQGAFEQDADTKVVARQILARLPPSTVLTSTYGAPPGAQQPHSTASPPRSAAAMPSTAGFQQHPQAYALQGRSDRQDHATYSFPAHASMGSPGGPHMMEGTLSSPRWQQGQQGQMEHHHYHHDDHSSAGAAQHHNTSQAAATVHGAGGGDGGRQQHADVERRRREVEATRDAARKAMLDTWMMEMRGISAATHRAEVASQAATISAAHAAEARQASRAAELDSLLDALADVDKIAREIEEEAKDTRVMMQELEEVAGMSADRTYNRLMVEAQHLTGAVDALLAASGKGEGGEKPSGHGPAAAAIGAA